jgi:hypothetical protein
MEQSRRQPLSGNETRVGIALERRSLTKKKSDVLWHFLTNRLVVGIFSLRPPFLLHGVRSALFLRHRFVDERKNRTVLNASASRVVFLIVAADLGKKIIHGVSFAQLAEETLTKRNRRFLCVTIADADRPTTMEAVPKISLIRPS